MRHNSISWQHYKKTKQNSYLYNNHNNHNNHNNNLINHCFFKKVNHQGVWAASAARTKRMPRGEREGPG